MSMIGRVEVFSQSSKRQCSLRSGVVEESKRAREMKRERGEGGREGERDRKEGRG